MGKFRFKSLENIAKELDHFKEHGITTLNIWDDSLTSVLYPGALGREKGRKYLMEIAKMLKDRGFAYEFSQGVVIKDLYDKEKDRPDFELISTLYSNEMRNGKFVGCYGEYFPLEHLQTEDTSQAYAKLMTFDKEMQVLEAILDAGTKLITYSSIIGTKEDTPKGFELATKRAKQIKELFKSKGGKSLVTPFIHSIFPGARDFEKYKENIEYSIEEFPELYQLNTSVIRNQDYQPHEITLAKREMERQLMTSEQLVKWNATGRYQWE